MITIYIYWDDLTKEAQQNIKDELGLKPGDNNIWENVPIPIASADIEQYD